MKTLAFVLFAGLASLKAFATVTLPTEQTYRSGSQLCLHDYASLIAYEKGFYTSVPLDYENPRGPRTQVYAYFSEGFDASKPTVFYFKGGPGQTSHWGSFHNPKDMNVLMIDQRGIACSRPETLQQYLSPTFYSSENVARDAEEIRKSLKLEKITAFGVSYGTLPATMYASLFPTSTRALVLEGTSASGDGTQLTSEFGRQQMQTFFDQLPKDIQTLIIEGHTKRGLPASWFHQMARNELMFNDGAAKFHEKLLQIRSPKVYEDFLKTAKEFLTPDPTPPHPLFPMNDIPYFMISCQELGFALPNSNAFFALNNGRFSPAADLNAQASCRQLNASTQRLYDAKNYPVTIPVTYFQGDEDSATPLPGALQHYAEVPKGPKQLLLLKHGGHNPNLTNISLNEEGQWEMYKLAVAGQEIPADLLLRVQQNQLLRWEKTSSGF